MQNPPSHAAAHTSQQANSLFQPPQGGITLFAPKGNEGAVDLATPPHPCKRLLPHPSLCNPRMAFLALTGEREEKIVVTIFT